MKFAKQVIFVLGVLFFHNSIAVQIVVDAQNQGDFALVSEALNYIDSNRLTTPQPTQTPISGSNANTYTASTVVVLHQNISNFSSFDEFSDGLLIKFAGDNHWYSAKYFSTNALHLSEKAHKDLTGVAWELAIKTPYEVLIRNGVYADNGTKPIAPFVTIRGESKRGVIIQNGGPLTSFKFAELCKEATLDNFSIISPGAGQGGSIDLFPNPDNSPYVDWVFRNMHIDVSRSSNPDTFKFFWEKINTVTIENSHIEGNFHVLNLWGTTGAIIRNNVIVGHVSSNTHSLIGIYMKPATDINVQIENNEFVIIGNRANSTFPTYFGSHAIMFESDNGQATINGAITGNTIRVSSFNDNSAVKAEGISVAKLSPNYPTPVWNALIDQNVIEVDTRNAQQCHINSVISLNGGTILSGDEQSVIRCGLAY